MGREIRLVTDGGRDLRAWIAKRYPVGGVPRFCEEHKLDRIAVQRAMNGETKRISVDFAHLIETATAGKDRVRWDRWLTSTAKAPAARAA